MRYSTLKQTDLISSSNATVTITIQIGHTVPEEVEVFSRFFPPKKELKLVVVSKTLDRRGNFKRSQKRNQNQK